ncbi:MAG: LysR family transcriptional regulator [Myxococcales bacterium]|nr:LysR family transcriptional regulator [Myxococcales bacterium]
MNWDDLQIVLALARAGSLSGAAKALRVTHTTVGRRLRQLEEGLGVRLFDQTPDGFVATAAGQDMRAVAEAVEGQVLALEGRVQGRDVRLQGPLRVSTMDLLARRYVGQLQGFLTRYPGVALTLTTTDDEVSLTRRHADVALRLTNSPPPYAIGRRVDEVAFAAYGRRDLVAAHGGPDAPWAALPWLSWDERGPAAQWLDGWLAQNAPGARVALRIDLNSAGIVHAVQAGLGVHFLPLHEGDAQPDLVRVGRVLDEFTRGVWLLTLDELRHTPRVRAFMDHMAETIAAETP